MKKYLKTIDKSYNEQQSKLILKSKILGSNGHPGLSQHKLLPRSITPPPGEPDHPFASDSLPYFEPDSVARKFEQKVAKF